LGGTGSRLRLYWVVAGALLLGRYWDGTGALLRLYWGVAGALLGVAQASVSTDPFRRSLRFPANQGLISGGSWPVLLDLSSSEGVPVVCRRLPQEVPRTYPGGIPGCTSAGIHVRSSEGVVVNRGLVDCLGGVWGLSARLSVSRRETHPKHIQNRCKSEPKIYPNPWKSMEIHANHPAGRMIIL
jgi:hypothetical protein